MIADPHRRLMSVEEYLELERQSRDVRHEYIDGIVTMLAVGTTNHARICVNLISLLHTVLRGTPCQVFTSDLRVSVAQTRYVYPDASVSCDPHDLEDQGDILHAPCVVFEVLSPSTEAYDRGKKFSFYRGCPSLQEYVLISTQEQAVDVYRRATDNLWTLHPFGPGDEILLKSISMRFPLASVYEHVPLPEEGV